MECKILATHILESTLSLAPPIEHLLAVLLKIRGNIRDGRDGLDHLG